MIIIEGSDHLGKSTFAKRFKKKVKHLGIPAPDWDYWTDYIRLIEDNVVYDRFHLGAVVYGLCLRRHSVHPQLCHRIADVNEKLYDAGASMTVIHTTDLDWYEYHLRENPKMEAFTVDTIIRANQIFPFVAPSWARAVDIEDGRWDRL